MQHTLSIIKFNPNHLLWRFNKLGNLQRLRNSRPRKPPSAFSKFLYLKNSRTFLYKTDIVDKGVEFDNPRKEVPWGEGWSCYLRKNVHESRLHLLHRTWRNSATLASLLIQCSIKRNKWRNGNVFANARAKQSSSHQIVIHLPLSKLSCIVSTDQTLHCSSSIQGEME